MNLTESQRLIFETTSLRLAYTSGVNFFPPLEAIRKDLNQFQNLKMPERYYAMKELQIMFRPESPVSALAGKYY
ncbi:MAG: hypothetical protein LUH19_04655, partial [Lachnospiraceae bacterium]|nr:hypothetical protein [Lachnospiraceae bacterium]